MDAKNRLMDSEPDLSTAEELANQVFRCRYHTFMTKIKVMKGFPPAIGHPGVKRKLDWVRDKRGLKIRKYSKVEC